MVVRNIERIRSAVARRAASRVRKLSARASNARRPVILMYHRIADERFDPWGLAVAPDRFAEQLAWLAENRALLSLPDFASRHSEGQLPEDAVAVTFDDGYACTAQVAAPLLDRFGIPATIFLPAAVIGQARRFWWDELSEIVMNHRGTSIHARGRRVDLGERQDGDAVWPRDNRKRTARQKAFYALWAELQPRPLEEIERTLAELRAQYPAPLDEDRQRLMTVEEARSIRSDHIQFGSHALTHVSLPGLTVTEKEREIRGSVAACERLVGSRPTTFAYPFGDYDRECEKLVSDAGFACACTVKPRAVGGNDDPFALPRVKVGNWTARQMRQELADLAFDQAQNRA